MWLGILLFIVVATVLKVAAASPTWLHFDENYYLNISQNFIERGELTPYMWRLGETNIIAGSGSGYGVLLLTVWLQTVGVSLFNGRLLMIILGLVTAGVLYFAASQWWNSRAAGIIALIFAVVSTTPFYSLVMRMDAPGMLAYSLVLLLHIYAVRQSRLWLHAGVGIAAVIAVEFHILGLLYLLALGFYYGLTYLQVLIRERRVLIRHPAMYFGTAGLVMGVLYLMVHIAPDPEAYFVIARQCMGCDGPSIFKEMLRFGWYFQFRYFEVIALVVTLFFIARKGERGRHYLILVAGWIIAEAVVSPPPFIHYTSHLWPLIAIGMGGLVSQRLTAEGKIALWRGSLLLGLAGLVLAVNFGLHLSRSEPVAPRHDAEVTPPVAFVQETVPTEIPILADVELYHFFVDYQNFLSYQDGENYGIELRDESYLDYWRREQPLVVVGDYRADDRELDQYMTEMNFTTVMPGVWVASSLRQQLDLGVAQTVEERG